VLATEERLGRRLPLSVREWVAFAHDIRTDVDNRSLLTGEYVGVYQMQEIEGRQAICLQVDHTGKFLWAVRCADLEIIDPPVYFYDCDFSSPNPYATVTCRHPPRKDDTVTLFTLNYSLLCNQSAAGGFFTELFRNDLTKESEELVRACSNEFPVHFKLGNADIFEDENILVRLYHVSETNLQILVDLFRPMPREVLPEFLRDYSRQGVHGMYVGERT